MSNLQQHIAKFDQLVMIDNSVHDEGRQPQSRHQCTLEQGRVVGDDEPRAALVGPTGHRSGEPTD